MNGLGETRQLAQVAGTELAQTRAHPWYKVLRRRRACRNADALNMLQPDRLDLVGMFNQPSGYTVVSSHFL